MKRFAQLTVVGALLAGAALLVFGKVCSIRFEQNCGGYLKRAADANTVQLARQELTKAVDYLERANLMSGSTHVMYETPKCDLGFWYTNLKASLTELESLPTDTDSLTRSNQLLKLRETIMDQGKKGTKVTAPPLVHVFPNQVAFAIAGLGVLAVVVSSSFFFAANCGCKSPEHADKTGAIHRLQSDGC